MSILLVCNKNFIKIYNLNPSKSTSGNLSKETILNTTKYAPKSLYTKILIIALFTIMKLYIHQYKLYTNINHGGLVAKLCLTLVTPWTGTHQAPLFTGFSRQECWSGCHFLLQGIFPTQGSNPSLLCLLYWQADSLPLSNLESPFLNWTRPKYLLLYPRVPFLLPSLLLSLYQKWRWINTLVPFLKLSDISFNEEGRS